MGSSIVPATVRPAPRAQVAESDLRPQRTTAATLAGVTRRLVKSML